MRGFFRFCSVALAVIILFTSVAPVQAAELAAAGNIKAQIQNKTGAQVRISFTGAKTYWFTLSTGKNTLEMAPDRYKYSYYACGETQTGTFNAKKSGANLTLAACPKSAAATANQVKFQNKTGERVTLQLTGPKTYWFYVNSGTTKQEITPGKYRYSYTACGQTKTGNFNATKNGATLVIPKCPNAKTTSNSSKTIKITVKNQTGGSLSIYLSGPASYAFYQPTGTSKIEVLPGKYNFTVYGCGTSIRGTKNFKGGGNSWLFWCSY